MKGLAVVCLFCVIACKSLAQGVPVFDASAFQQKLEAFLHLEQDQNTQVEKVNNRADIRDFEQQQVETLDQMINAFSSVSTFNASFVSGVDDQYASVAETYGPLANPAGAVMFGDARHDIEAVIVAGTGDTYNLKGVQEAGLSALQWRCLMQALIWQESRFQVGARSTKAAYGLTQIIPDTAKYLDIYPEYYDDPYLQVTGGARYFAEQLDRFNGNIIYALAAYNAGPGNVSKYNGVPPFQETQHYVQVIPEKYNTYLLAIGGAEALGTLQPEEYAVANASLMSMGSMAYGEHNMELAQQSLLRVQALVEQINTTSTIKEAYDLNTAIRAEVILILLERIKTKAIRTQAEYAEIAWLLTKQREAIKAFDFTLSEY